MVLGSYHTANRSKQVARHILHRETQIGPPRLKEQQMTLLLAEAGARSPASVP